MISNIINGIVNGGAKIIENVKDLKKVSSVDKTQQENNIHLETVESLKAFAAEMGKENKNKIDSIIDAFARLPRPIIAFMSIGILLLFIINPSYGLKVGAAFSVIPEELFWLIGTVIAFYFGGRMYSNKVSSSRPSMTSEQFEIINRRVQQTESKVIENQENIKFEISKTNELLKDINNNGIDDRGEELTKKFEGYSDKMYKCPAGFFTIGNGINLEAQKIPKIVSDLWFSIILKNTKEELFKKYPDIKKLDEVRQYVLIDIAFNIGVNNGALKSISSKLNSNEEMAKEMKSWKWYNQVGNRSKILHKMMLTGEWPKS